MTRIPLARVSGHTETTATLTKSEDCEMTIDWWAIAAGLYVGMAVNLAMNTKRHESNSIAGDIGTALCLSIWPLPAISGIIKGVFKR